MGILAPQHLLEVGRESWEGRRLVVEGGSFEPLVACWGAEEGGDFLERGHLMLEGKEAGRACRGRRGLEIVS